MAKSLSGKLRVVTFFPRLNLRSSLKAFTLRGLARSFLLRASAATFAFLGMCCRVSCSSSHELLVVGRRKPSPSSSVSL
ncbi:hypothetical protein Tco_0890151 [Tanacetum coccineum]